MKVLIIDNYDSFTFNLFQDVGKILRLRNDGSTVKVVRNNEWNLDQIRAYAPDRLIISPGPGNPADPAYFGVCSQAILELGPHIPTLGVCLGMQGICHFFGARITHAHVPMHGKLSPISHDGRGVYAGLPQGIEIMRYHSLVADPATLPDCLEINSCIQVREGAEMTSQIADGSEIMGVRHKEYPIEGIQFHPESFGTEGGVQMLRNFLEQK